MRITLTLDCSKRPDNERKDVIIGEPYRNLDEAMYYLEGGLHLKPFGDIFRLYPYREGDSSLDDFPRHRKSECLYAVRDDGTVLMDKRKKEQADKSLSIFDQEKAA